ncbi:methylmalonyl-CoA mutase family protein [Neolewinella persica]|uniref:methylmalonyl-CoA mutase family protein n=1 Tax=Neolewinella persica TaxID=70998 RepID=UPI00036008F6|nr:methylmalonyl-CoA mutase family protein [Neolewinella persica]
MEKIAPYKATNKIRVLTAGSLFDGHDVAINIMRRIIQRSGAEVIHLGHNRPVMEVVNAAIQEDVQCIALTSYQGGHMEYFKYAYDLLREKNAGHIKIFGGGGGTILPTEIEELHAHGIDRVFSPDDGRSMGLQGMINYLLEKSDFPVGNAFDPSIASRVPAQDHHTIARTISAAENYPKENASWLPEMKAKAKENPIPVLGITGTGGAGKSSLVDELVLRYLTRFPKKKLGIISVDPSKRKTGGALLGDRIRMNAIANDRVFMRSLATRQYNAALSADIDSAIAVMKTAGFDLIILETSGIGQSDSEIVDHADLSVYVMTPEFGAPSQLEKIDMLDFADLIVLNKFDKRGALDAIRAVRKQYQRNNDLWDKDLETMPVFGTIASQFNDPGVNTFSNALMSRLFPEETAGKLDEGESEKQYIIPPSRVRYLSEISETIRRYDKEVEEQSELARTLFGIQRTMEHMGDDAPVQGELEKARDAVSQALTPENKALLDGWEAKKASYQGEHFTYEVRGREIKVENFTVSLSHNRIPKVVLPRWKDYGEIVRWTGQENVPGEFPFTAGVFPFKRKGEDPTRMFAGEGGPERTNKRFHYLSKGTPAKRLSTAFDSVTLYGEDPNERPDIYGKVGNSGVNVSSLNDAKKLYSGFDLCHPKTSVSMTINGPAAIVTAFFMNAAIDQQCERYITEHGLEAKVEAAFKKHYDDKGIERPRYNGELPDGNDGLGLMLLGLTGDQVLDAAVYADLKAKALKAVRGTVQADILKEDQAQNTCIFSTEFSLKLMGDMQQTFIDQGVRNFYSVSISGYHIAEAGANPISQLAFTLSNGFTFVEYYLSRGMDINDFAPNLSYFFSNGVDPEYAVIGRVARRIWSKAMKYKYEANDRSQKLKYHIQTSGRSLHAQEIDFNDIRTTLQALYAIYDNCNSLHTNAYDEAITTPTEDSVRRAVAIQMIINHELGLAKNENPLQGSFIIDELTDLVEEAVLLEFDRMTERGGVIGAMETMYQRGKIQEESMHYEMLKHTGEYPIIGVNTFLSSKGSPTVIPEEVIRATEDEKQLQIANLNAIHEAHSDKSAESIAKLKTMAVNNENVFEELLDTVKHCSLGQITNALFSVGGQYRRSM